MWIQPWKELFLSGLQEDEVGLDWTSRSISTTQKKKSLSQATLIAKGEGVWCGDGALRALETLSVEMGTPVEVKTYTRDGDSVQAKTKIASLHGPADAIVTFERTLINLVSYTSGIATQTRRLVDRVRKSGLDPAPRITATRKTLPGYKEISIHSTLVGGAFPHRYNLSGGILLKENHIAAHGSIERAIQAARQVSPHLLKVEIEVRDLAELQEAIRCGAEVIMLDNFSPDQVKAALALKRSGTLFEISGGISLNNLDSYLIPGVDIISVGSLTHSVQALDLSLLMDSLL